MTCRNCGNQIICPSCGCAVKPIERKSNLGLVLGLTFVSMTFASICIIFFSLYFLAMNSGGV